MSNYWQKRMLSSQEALQKKTVKQTEAQLAKYYKSTMKSVIAEFEALFDKLLATLEEGKEPTVADLYKLDKYWSMQGQLKNELRKLGELEAVLLSEKFEAQWLRTYNITEQDLLAYFNNRAKDNPDLEPLVWPPDQHFKTISADNAKQMINQVWCADGKSWSDRVWGNIEDLAQTLNDKLIECVVTGKNTTQLKKELQHRFDVSFSRADTLIRTETAHITTQAAAQRYKDYGLDKYEILGREETTGCNHSIDCHKMDGKQFLYSEMIVGKNAPPFHPNCRCAITPVIE